MLRLLSFAFCCQAALFLGEVFAQEPRTVPDRSLVAGDYVALGLPAPDREWLGHDYLKAAGVLAGLAKTNHLALPRFESKRSSQVFARIVSPSNFAILSKTDLPPSQRLQMVDGYVTGGGQILRAYLSGIVKEEGGYDAELVELVGFMLVGFTNAFQLAEEFRVSLPVDDPKVEVRKAGLEQMKSGLATSANGIFLMLSDRNLQHRAKLARYFESALPVLKHHLPPLTLSEMHARAVEMAKSESDKAVLMSLTRISAVLAPTKPAKITK